MTISATYLCDVCGSVASTVTVAEPGQPDPRLTPEPTGAPPGISMLFSEYGRLSIDGGPVSLTLGVGDTTAVAAALETGSAAALFALDPEFAPFWCPACGASYCREHYRSFTLYDDGYFDCIRGICPKGHERTLED